MTEKQKPLKVLFLSSDTGGGHRASSESLAAQFKILFPGSTYDLLDIMKKDSVPPYNKLVETYKHLGAHPQQWNLVFKFSNSKAFEYFFDVSQKALCEKAMRKSIMEYNPDVVVSVHPMMTNVPALCCQNISEETGKYLPIFTVVTDLGSAHCLWFCNGVDKMFVASDQIRHLAKVRGKVPDEKLVQIGLPIRQQFAEQAELLGDRMSPEGSTYQQHLRGELGLPVVDKKSVLVMGGGDGFGSLSKIVDALYVEFEEQGIDALIMVVCGRNETLKHDLESRDWDAVVKQRLAIKENRASRLNQQFSLSSCVPGSKGVLAVTPSGCMEGSVTQQIRKILSTSSMKGLNSKENVIGDPELISPSEEESGIFYDAVPDINRLPTMPESELDEQRKKESIHVGEARNRVDTMDIIHADKFAVPSSKKGSVTVVGLGFVTNIADYMVAADVLVSKAGPGTIAEAASLSLPVMLTSFLPGQEEGNVDFVVKNEFGTYISESNPSGISEAVGQWLTDDRIAREMSEKAKACGAPTAARDIVQQIGNITHKWKKINEDRMKLELAAERLRLGLPSTDEEEIAS
jgi:1,2-diacylglycerol 3-beta-galactosyltransferase